FSGEARACAVVPEQTPRLLLPAGETPKIRAALPRFVFAILRAFIEQQQYDIWRTHQLRLVIALNDDERAVGAVDLFDFDPLNRRAGVGVLVADGERCRGYATEALTLFVEYARDVLMLNQLYCDIDTDNTACRALFAGCKFEECGVRRRWRLGADGWHDVVMMQRLF
ncbi:MAG: GNAT family N-acetyltransferase, partial [Rikenellaceae bacterium]|nr:GNAT family N-acetyltransferase [Rikenellaceae bacterium]